MVTVRQTCGIVIFELAIRNDLLFQACEMRLQKDSWEFQPKWQVDEQQALLLQLTHDAEGCAFCLCSIQAGGTFTRTAKQTKSASTEIL